MLFSRSRLKILKIIKKQYHLYLEVIIWDIFIKLQTLNLINAISERPPEITKTDGLSTKDIKTSILIILGSSTEC